MKYSILRFLHKYLLNDYSVLKKLKPEILDDAQERTIAENQMVNEGGLRTVGTLQIGGMGWGVELTTWFNPPKTVVFYLFSIWKSHFLSIFQ